MSRYNKFKELTDRFRQHTIDNNISIVMVQYPFKHRYYPTEHIIIDSIPKFKP